MLREGVLLIPPAQVFVQPCSEVNRGTRWQEEISKIVIFDLQKFLI